MSRFITGVYNYCDAWCKRCPFTQRCRNYVEDTDTILNMKPGEVPDEEAVRGKFWEQLAANLRFATAFGKREVDFDWDYADIQPDEDEDDPFERCDELAQKHPLVILSHEYWAQAEAWLDSDSTDKVLKQLAQEWVSQAGSSPYDKTDYEAEALKIKDLLEVASWYDTLLRSKMYRAIHGYYCEVAEGRRDPEAAIYPSFSDAAGTGKLMLVSIERSIAAWSGLLQHLKSEEETILKLLVMLQKMQQGIKRVLPDAEHFRRPGFDAGPNIFDTD